MNAIGCDHNITSDTGAVNQGDCSGVTVDIGYCARGVQFGGHTGPVLGEGFVLECTVKIHTVDKKVFLQNLELRVVASMFVVHTACQLVLSSS